MRRRKSEAKRQEQTKRYSNLLNRLVKPSRGGSNKVNAQDISQKSVLSPRGIVYEALRDIYRIESDEDDLNKFEERITTGLSKLASKGKHDNLFTKGFNTFFEMVVSSLNVMDGMMQALKENGIEFSPKKYLDDLYGRGKDENDK